MRSPMGLVSLTGRFARRRVGFAALALAVIMLAGGVPPHAEAQDVPGGTLYIKFSNQTLPIDVNAKSQPILCQGSHYTILAEAVQIVGQVQKRLHAGIEVARVLNPISPGYLEIRDSDPAGAFAYDAKKIGNETLVFDAYEKTVLTGNQNTQPKIGEKTIEFEVRECTYTVSLVYSATFASAGVTGGLSIIELETRLLMQGDGTYKGTGLFELRQPLVAPGCSISASGFDGSDAITGELSKDAHQLKLTFAFQTGKNTVYVSCGGPGGSGSATVDVGQILGTDPKQFPEEGGSKTFKTPKIPAFTSSPLTIIVNQSVAR